MDYGAGSIGRVFVIRFHDGDDVIGGFAELARKENVRAGVIQILGGMRSGRFVVGPESEELPPKPVWRDLGESHELLGVGTLFWDDERPVVHLHGAFGKHDRTRVGCVREDTETFLVLEAVMHEILGVEGTRTLDPLSGMRLLNLHGGRSL